MSEPQIASALAEAMGDDEERRRRGERGREFARSFEASKIAGKLMELYTAVIEGVKI
jgi:glycosyltransferase involved in cell wall biosynthesis